MKIKLRDHVKDTVTDFEGMVTARVIYLNGCVRCQVQPKGLDKDGKIIESEWIDEGQLYLEKLDFNEEGVRKDVKKGPGGPRDEPTIYREIPR